MMEYAVLNTHNNILGKKVTPRHSIEVNLADKELFRLENFKTPVRLVCMKGILWVTKEGDEQDYHLQACQSLTINQNGLVLVQGYPAGQMNLIVS